MRLTLTEAIDYLGVSERTARRWIRDRGLPVHRADERLFVNPVELWEWAVEHNVPVSSKVLEEARRQQYLRQQAFAAEAARRQWELARAAEIARARAAQEFARQPAPGFPALERPGREAGPRRWPGRAS